MSWAERFASTSTRPSRAIRSRSAWNRAGSATSSLSSATARRTRERSLSALSARIPAEKRGEAEQRLRELIDRIYRDSEVEPPDWLKMIGEVQT